MKEEKHLTAEGDVVFTRVVKGVHYATLYGEDVTLVRVKHNEWHCIKDADKEILGVGTTRNEAMREAFYVEAERQGYDQDEASRLDWVLVNQKYRSYNGHKPRKRTKHLSTPSNEKVISIDRKKQRESLIERYKTAYNSSLGGWLYYYRNPETGDIEGGIKGPFNSEKEMAAAIFSEIS